jgi:hypothetical protein
MEDQVTVTLAPQEVNVILQMIDKTPTTGVQTMQVLLIVHQKLIQAVNALNQRTVSPE